MAWDQPIDQGDVSLAATTDMSGATDNASKQYRCVQCDTTAPGYIIMSTAGSAVLGILQDAPAVGQKGQVRYVGVSKAFCGAGVTFGWNLKSDANGALVHATGTDTPVAVALDSGSNGDLIPVLLGPNSAAGISGGEGEKVFTIPVVAAVSGTVLAGIPCGTTGAVTGFYARIVTADTKAGAGVLSLKNNAGATMTGSSVAITGSQAVNTLVNSTAITANNTFVATDTLTIYNTVTTTFAGSALVLEIHIITS